MRAISHIVVHCSATRAAADIGAAEIRHWHTSVQGWRDIGYHYVIRRDGRLEGGRPLKDAGAHVAGHNAHSIGICLVGGLNEAGRPGDNFTSAQMGTLKDTILNLRSSFPKAEVLGHRDYQGVKKDCPCFDVKNWLKKEGLA